MRPLLLLLSLVACAPALAHDGHGAFAGHLHPGEALGLLALAAVVAVLVLRWWRR